MLRIQFDEVRVTTATGLTYEMVGVKDDGTEIQMGYLWAPDLKYLLILELVMIR
jgi:hypothetical protein